MSEKMAFHLGLKKSDLQGATLAIIPGDPERVKKIAARLDNAIFLAACREFTSWRGELAGQAVVVCSTGIGGPSTSIAVEELAQFGINTFLRIGTTGAIQSAVEVGSMIVTTASVRLDGASLHFAPLAYPAAADFSCTTALVQAAIERQAALHVGIAVSSDTFYPGQGRYDTFSGRITRDFEGLISEWQKLGALNYEMESATLFTQCASMQLRAGMIAGVIVNRTQQEQPSRETLSRVESEAIEVVVAAAKSLLSI
jgi:uridine phosphorylase